MPTTSLLALSTSLTTDCPLSSVLVSAGVDMLSLMPTLFWYACIWSAISTIDLLPSLDFIDIQGSDILRIVSTCLVSVPIITSSETILTGSTTGAVYSVGFSGLSLSMGFCGVSTAISVGFIWTGTSFFVTLMGGSGGNILPNEAITAFCISALDTCLSASGLNISSTCLGISFLERYSSRDGYFPSTNAA